MEEELTTNRQQIEDLKKEIENVERDFRLQIAANEKKAHENWVSGDDNLLKVLRWPSI